MLDSDVSSVLDDEDDHEKQQEISPILSVKQAGLFLLKAKEIYKVPQ